MDVPDRLPFEVAARFWGSTPALPENHQVQGVERVPATKPGQATVRPFVRVHPRDMLLYQSLVDAMRDPIEQTLGPPEQVLAYRIAPLDEDDPSAGSPRWTDFNITLHQLAADALDGYVIEADVASYFLNISVTQLERRLLEAGCDGGAVRDLGALLAGWASQGVRGLPQGCPPSSPLANFYLSPLDNFLRGEAVPFVRYMDDIAIVCPTHHEARQLLDGMEELLYEDGLSLGGGKTRIWRSEHVLERLTPEEGVEEMIAELQEGDYAPDDEQIDEIRIDRVCSIFDAAVNALSSDEYRRNDFTFAFRQLARERHPHALAATPQVLLRMPGLTANACRYIEAIAKDEHREEVASALNEIATGRFHRTQEWLHILRAMQVIPAQGAAELANQMAALAAEHEHPLVRARAVLAWGSQSDPGEFSAADLYFARESRQWLPYVLIAIQEKNEQQRDDRYGRWSGEGRSLARLADSIKSERYGWTRI